MQLRDRWEVDLLINTQLPQGKPTGISPDARTRSSFATARTIPLLAQNGPKQAPEFALT